MTDAQIEPAESDELAPDPEIEADFEPADPVDTLLSLLVRGVSRREIARQFDKPVELIEARIVEAAARVVSQWSPEVALGLILVTLDDAHGHVQAALAEGRDLDSEIGLLNALVPALRLRAELVGLLPPSVGAAS